MFSRIASRFAALSLAAKVLLSIVALIVLGLIVALSPLVAILAFLALLVALFALFIRFLRRRPLRRWGFVALASLLLVVLFSGLTNALYGGGQPEQASAPGISEEANQDVPTEEVEQEEAGVEAVDPPEEEPASEEAVEEEAAKERESESSEAADEGSSATSSVLPQPVSTMVVITAATAQARTRRPERPGGLIRGAFRRWLGRYGDRRQA